MGPRSPEHPTATVFIDDDEIDAALFGSGSMLYNPGGEEKYIPMGRVPSGYWRADPPAGTRVSAVLMGRNIDSYGAAKDTPRMWINQCCWPLTVTRYRDATKPPRRSRLYSSTDSGTIAEMDARSRPGLNDPFEEAIDDALSSLPDDLRAAMSNVEIVVEDEPPDGQPLLGLYRGVPLPRRSSTYSGVLPDKISIFGGPIARLAAGDGDRLRREVRHVVLHEIAHHFGISDERLIELDRY